MKTLCAYANAVSPNFREITSGLHLLVANCELALRLLVLVRVCLQLLDWVALQDGDGKLDVGLCVLVARLS
jgi:hypothetical protein